MGFNSAFKGLKAGGHV